MYCPRCNELWSKTGLPRAGWVVLKTDEGDPYYAHYHLAVSQWDEPTQWQHIKLQEGKLAENKKRSILSGVGPIRGALITLRAG